MSSNRLWLPDWLYEALPYLYVAGGLGVVVVFKNAWGVLAGLMFVATGVVVWFVRRSRRSEILSRRARPRGVQRSDPSPDERKSYYNNYD